MPPVAPFRRRREVLTLVGSAAGSLGIAGCLGRPDRPTEPRSETGRTTAVDTAPSRTDPRTTTADTTMSPIHASYDTTEVRVTTPNGRLLGAVTAAIADTPELRYTGLSETDSLPPDRGMLFVFGTVGDRTFVMRDMSFGIDIVYADAAGVITRIHNAPAPAPDEDGATQTYPGRGKYVLEVNLGWMAAHGVEPGDRLAFEL